ncbi:unnamed protein product [Boreogadus saida]
MLIDPNPFGLASADGRSELTPSHRRPPHTAVFSDSPRVCGGVLPFGYYNCILEATLMYLFLTPLKVSVRP